MNPKLTDTLDRILPFVEKPSRYVGGETNSVRKPHDGKTSIVLSYPDAYEIGISNLGLKILYRIVNAREDMVCESVYAPMQDMEEAMRREGVKLFSLESGTPVSDFDVVGFTFQYELVFTNFLNLLDLAGIPFRSKDRRETDPFVIGGGPAMLNPEPVAPFLDAVCIGDGETRIIEIARVVGEGRREGLTRNAILQNLSRLEGVYVPSLYEERIEGGFVIPVGAKVRRFIEPDLDVIDFPVEQILPNIKAVQDRAVVEAARGCSRGCRFCQAGFAYRPVRERSVAKILDLARKTVRATGYREVSLISLSISDYSRLPELIRVFDEQFSPKGVSFSLPSLRLDSFTLDLAQRVSAIRSSGLTFAVEGGTQAIRDAINKGVGEDELFEVVKIASDLGWKSVKLYFMIGLPGWNKQNDESSLPLRAQVETASLVRMTQSPQGDELSEAEAIAMLCEKLTRKYPKLSFTASVGVFVPKPHTPFQREPQMPPETAWNAFKGMIAYIKRYRRVGFRFNDPYCSRLEGVFSRGDRKLADAVEEAFRLGARFDGWSEKFDKELWENAFAQTGIDPEKYLGGRPGDNVPLPWSVVDCGEPPEFFGAELGKSLRGESTPDCREECSACGICDSRAGIANRNAAASEPVVDPGFLSRVNLRAPAVSSVRFVYTKLDSLKYMSPIDLEELFARAFIRSNLPVKFTEGYNPHVRLEMGWAIPVGFESLYEAAQLDLTEMMTAEEFVASMNATLPEGVRIVSARIVEISNRLNKRGHEQFVKFTLRTDAESAKARFEAQPMFEKTTKNGTKTIDMREFIRGIEATGEGVEAVYFQKDGGARIQDVAQCLTGLDVRGIVAAKPTIAGRFVEKDGREVSLLEL